MRRQRSESDFETDLVVALSGAAVGDDAAAELPGGNPVVAGRWTPEEAEGLSVEEGLAKTLGLKLGDRLGFDMAGQTYEGRITSLRVLVGPYVAGPWSEGAYEIALEAAPMLPHLAPRFAGAFAKP
jgi:hypothetical protein